MLLALMMEEKVRESRHARTAAPEDRKAKETNSSLETAEGA